MCSEASYQVGQRSVKCQWDTQSIALQKTTSYSLRNKSVTDEQNTSRAAFAAQRCSYWKTWPDYKLCVRAQPQGFLLELSKPS